MHAVHVHHIARKAFENRLHHHLEHDPRQRGADASVRPEPERDVAIGRPVQYHFVGPLELLRVVVGREPADEHLVVTPELLAAEHGVATDSAAQRLVDRAVAEKLICCSAVEARVVDELLS